MTENEARAAVVAEAMKWVATPYHPNADIVGVGVDCGMLLVRAFVDSGLVPHFDPRPYPSQWHLHQRAERYMSWVKNWAKEIRGPDEGFRPLPGDIVLFHYGLCYAHGAIVTEWPVVIHALGPNPVARQQVTSNTMLRKLRKKYFSIWEQRELEA